MNYVIVGNSAAAVGAVEGIRSVDQEGKIILISDEPYHTYSRPLISYYLAGKVCADKMYYRDNDFYQKNGVTTLLDTKVTGVDTENKQIILGDDSTVSYDKLLVATGGKPFVPPMEGLEKEKVYTFLKWDDAKEIEKTAGDGKRAVIIGAGLIGLKAAEALVELGVQVTVVELADRILSSILDAEAADIVQRYLEDQGIEFKLNTTVDSILGDGQVSGVELKTAETIDCDFLIVAIGVVPNTDIIRDTAVEVNRGILVDDRLQTSVDAVYAAGDVSEGYDLLYGERRVLAILPNAYKQGEAAGINMAGGDRKFSGGYAVNSIGLFGLYINTAGIINPRQEGYEVLVKAEAEKDVYKKLVLQNDRLVGFIMLNEIDRSGILTGLIDDGVAVADFKEKLLEETGLINLPDNLRRARQNGGAA